MKKFLLIIVSIICVVTSSLYAYQFFYKVDNTKIVKVDEHNICKNVEVKDTNKYFIPTKTKKEWESFIEYTPKNVALSNCKKLSYTFPDIDYSRARNDYGPEINRILNDNEDDFHAGFQNTYNSPNEIDFAVLDDEGTVTAWGFGNPGSFQIEKKYQKLYSGQQFFYGVTKTNTVERILPKSIPDDKREIQGRMAYRKKKIKKVYTNFRGPGFDHKYQNNISMILDRNYGDDVIVLYEDGKIQCALSEYDRQVVTRSSCMAKNLRGTEDRYLNSGNNPWDFKRDDIVRVFPTKESFIFVNKNEKLEDAIIDQLSLLFAEIHWNEYFTNFNSPPNIAKKKIYVTSTKSCDYSDDRYGQYCANYSFVGLDMLGQNIFRPEFLWMPLSDAYRYLKLNSIPESFLENLTDFIGGANYGGGKPGPGVNNMIKDNGISFYENCIYNGKTLDLIGDPDNYMLIRGHWRYQFSQDDKNCPIGNEGRYKKTTTNGKTVVGIKEDTSLTCFSKEENSCSNVPKDKGYERIFSNQYGYALLKTDGSIKCFSTSGQNDFNFDVCENIPKDKGYTNIYSSRYGFAAMKADGSIKSWGFGSPGINYNPPKDKGYKDIRTNATSFVAVKEDGTMACWGHPRFGWTCPKLNQDTKKKK